MSEQKKKSLFPKDFDWRRPFGSQRSGSTEQQTLSPGRSNSQPAARSRSSLRWRPNSSTFSIPTAASATVHTARSTPSAPFGGGQSVGAAALTVPAASSTPSAPSAPPASEDAAPIKSPTLWKRSLEIAQKKLSEKGLPPLKLSELSEHACQPASEIVQLTIGDLQSTMDRQQNDKSVAVQRLQEILKTFDKYARIVDTAIQHSPEVTALVWAGMRGILQVALNHMDVTESLEQITATIVEKVALCDFYASVYVETSLNITLSSAATMQHLQKMLDSALPELYAAVLVFSVKAHQYFEPSATSITKLTCMLKPFAIEFQPFIDDISEKEKCVRECADMATMKSIMEHSGKLEQIQKLLNHVELKVAPLTKLNEIFNVTECRRIQKLLQMLSPLESPKRHQDVRSSRVDGTGIWLLQQDRFCQWRDSIIQDANDRIMCCYGAPGAGKTVISSIVVDDLTSKFPRRDTVGIAYIYCDYRDQPTQTVVNILGSLLQQFLIAMSRVPDAVARLLESIQQQRKRVEIKDISKMFEITFSQFDRSFICIDALDELEPKKQKGLLEALCSGFSTARIFLTGRPHIQLAVNTYLGLDSQRQHPIDIIAASSDITAYIGHAIAEDTNPDAMNEQLRDEILSTVIEKSQGMFLLPVLHIRMILDQQTISDRREALKELPVGLDKAFTSIIDRIKIRPSGELGMRVLMWLHLAYRPLKLDELSHALAVRLKRDAVDLDQDNIPPRKALLECCLGLVILDEETMTVRFVHYSVEEHFKRHASTYFPNRYSIAAKTCLTYLNFNKLAHPCPTFSALEQKMKDFPFLEHAACHWGHYARQQPNSSVEELALKLLQHRSKEPHCALQALCYGYLWQKYWWKGAFTKLFFGIHAAACFGLGLYMISLVDGPEDWNIRDDNGQTPLSWAVMEGHENVVELLIKRKEVDVNSKDSRGYTTLSLAAQYGREAIVRLLIEREDLDADAKDNKETTPLSWAAMRGHEAIVRLLVERGDVDADSQDFEGKTPLSWAAMKGHESIVRLLVEREDVDADSKDSEGNTPLSWAAIKGHEAIVRLLVEREDVDADSKDFEGITPLSWAATKGHETIVQLLVERKDVDILSKDNSGQTPLSRAAMKGHEAIVQLLLKREDEKMCIPCAGSAKQ